MDTGGPLYSVRFSPAATREFKKLDRAVQERLDADIRQLERDPRPPGSRKMQPHHLERYRVRSGEMRIVYEVDDTARQLEVVTLGDRKDVYR